MGMKGIPLSVLAIAVAAGVYLYAAPRVTLPKHLLHNEAAFIPGLLPKEVGAELMKSAKEMKEFPSNVADLKVRALSSCNSVACVGLYKAMCLVEVH